MVSWIFENNCQAVEVYRHDFFCTKGRSFALSLCMEESPEFCWGGGGEKRWSGLELTGA